MSERPRKILCFDNYPEAKMSLGKVTFPAIIKPYSNECPLYNYEVKDYGEAVNALYDAFEHSSSNWIVIESY